MLFRSYASSWQTHEVKTPASLRHATECVRPKGPDGERERCYAGAAQVVSPLTDSRQLSAVANDTARFPVDICC